jgi:hypothetical protein
MPAKIENKIRKTMNIRQLTIYPVIFLMLFCVDADE